MEAIFKRRSIRTYQDRQVESEEITQLLKAAMQAPSAGNQQPWEFIVVSDKSRLEKLSYMSPYSKQIAKAPVAIVLLANTTRMKYPENWTHDMGAATQNLLLEATYLNLGAVWMSVAPLEDRTNYIKEMFNLEATLLPYCVVTVGYPDKIQNRFIDRFDSTRIHYEHF